MDIVTMDELATPSLTLNLNESAPFAPAFGVYVNAPVDALTVSEPFFGDDVTRYVSGSPSTSDAINCPLYGVLLGVVKLPACATGASFTGLTVIDTVAMLLSRLPSLTL